MHPRISYKVTKYLIFYVLFALRADQQQSKTQKHVSVSSGFSFIKISNPIDDLDVNRLVSQKELKLAIWTGDLTHSSTLDDNKSQGVSDDKEPSNETLHQDSDVKLQAVTGIQSQPHSENEDLELDGESLEDKSETQEAEAAEQGKIEPLDIYSKQKLERELNELLKKEKKLVRELEKTEFFAKIYSKEFLSEISFRKTIEHIKKYEQLKKSYEENRQLLDEKKAYIERCE